MALASAVHRLLASSGAGAATCGSCSSGSAAAAAAGQRLLQALHFASSSGSSSGGAAAGAKQQQVQPVDLESLTPEQRQHVRALQYLASRPLSAAHDAALLAAAAARYRDLYAVMDQMHKKDILGIPRPLTDDPPPPQPQQPQQPQQQQQAGNRTQMFFPVRDFTLLPDDPPPVGGWLRNHLSERYMTRITAFAQLLPNHLEVSYQTGAQVFLWPPMEAYYPGLLDTEGMMRYLKPSMRRRRAAPRSSRARRPRCRLGYARTTPYHKQRVFG